MAGHRERRCFACTKVKGRVPGRKQREGRLLFLVSSLALEVLITFKLVLMVVRRFGVDSGLVAVAGCSN
jgi:hypothetical protein|eukprot:scaffold1033_cov205-Alexandrium_tamarense.AAC.2